MVEICYPNPETTARRRRGAPGSHNNRNTDSGVGRSRGCFSSLGLSRNNNIPKRKPSDVTSVRSSPAFHETSALINPQFQAHWETFGSSPFTGVEQSPFQMRPQQQPIRIAPEPPPESSPSSRLLQPPKPQDRSHRRRLEYEQEQRKKAVYEGEIEPEGVRGQDAVVISPEQQQQQQQPSTNTIPLRSFSSSPNTSGPSIIKISNPLPPQKVGAATPKASSTTPLTGPLSLETITETSFDSDQYDEENRHASSMQPNKPPRYEDYRSAPRVVTPTASAPPPKQQDYNSRPPRYQHYQQQQQTTGVISDDSTTSDEELSNMMRDLMPETSFVRDTESQQQERSTSSSHRVITHHMLHQQDHTQNNMSRSAPISPSSGTPVAATTKEVDSINTRALQYVQAGDYNSALAAFYHVLQIQKQRYGDVHPMVASAYHNLGTVHAKRAQLLEMDSNMQHKSRCDALACFQSAARAARDSLGKDHPNVSVSLVRIGFLLLQARQYNNAIITFQEALRIRQASYGPKHGLVANLYNNLGVCYMHLGQFAHGRDLLYHALEIQRALLDEQQPSADIRSNLLELADTLFNIGGLSLEWIRRQGPDLRHAEDAELAFEEALDLRMEVLGPSDPSVFQVQSLLDVARLAPRPKSRSNPNSPNRRSDPSSPVRRSNPHSPASSSLSRSPSQSNPNSPGRGNYSSYSPNQMNNTVNRMRPTSSARSSPLEGSYLEPPHVLRSPAGQNHHPYEDAVNHQTTKALSDASGTTVKASGSPARSYDRPYDELTAGNISVDRSLYNLTDSPKKQKHKSRRQPPMQEVRVDDEPKEEQQQQERPRFTEVFISPHYVPHISPQKVNHIGHDASNTTTSFSPPPHDHPGMESSPPSISSNSAIQKQYSYDAEESFLLSDGGDGDHSTLDQSSSIGATAEKDSKQSRKIMVVRPYRQGASSDVGTSERDELYASAAGYSQKTGSFTRATIRGERSLALEKAKALLEANQKFMDSPTIKLSTEKAYVQPSPEKEPRRLVFDSSSPVKKKESSYDLDIADGVAPLGGAWPLRSLKEPFTPSMLSEPDVYLREIHDEASKCLKEQRFTQALDYFGVVLQCLRRHLGPLHQDVAAALHNVGIAHLRAGSNQEALRSFEEAVRVRKGALGRDHPQVASSLVKVGITYLLLHRFEDALFTFREALSVRKHSLGSLHPSTARIYNNIGCVHVEFNEFREARRAFEAALDIQRNALVHDPSSGPILFGAATTLCNIGYLYRYRGMYDRAALVLKEASEFQEQILGRVHPTVLSTLDSLAEAYTHSGQSALAYTTHETILERLKENSQPGSKRLQRAEAELLYKMSRDCKQQQNIEVQLKHLQRALRNVRTLDEQGEKEKLRSADLEKRILQDIREARARMEQSTKKFL